MNRRPRRGSRRSSAPGTSYYEALADTTRRCLYAPGGLGERLQVLTEAVAQAVDVARVSVWRLDDAQTAIVCTELFERLSGRHSAGVVLTESCYPRYFQAMRRRDVIAAHDACRHPSTREFCASYLSPLGITSMLDTPLHVREGVCGVLCLEHVGPARRWSRNEQGFALAAANLVSLMLEQEERRGADEALRLKSLALEAAANAVVITAPDGSIEWVNKAFSSLTGYTPAEVIGRNPRELVRSGQHEGALYEDLWRTITGGQVWHGELVNRRRDGTLYDEEQTITPVTSPDGAISHFIAVKQDISARKRGDAEREQLQTHLAQAQRLDSVGRLAGGVAHDFNNMLSVILGYSELLEETFPQGTPGRECVDEIRRAAERSADLTRQLLAFSRRQVIAPKVLDVNATIAGALKMLRPLIREDISLVWSPGADVGMIRADPTQIDQVLVNLAVNARDAIPGAGTLTLSTAAVTWDETAAAHHRGARPGTFVRISVSDTGCGMGPDILEHVFEPFFTTKVVGQGSGLGLATVYGIVKQNEGFVYAYSEPGHGTTFSIYLPQVAGASPEAALVRELPSGRHETVLVVDDEPSIVALARALLEGLQYKVLTASTPADAIELARSHEGPIDLLLSDVVMPELRGDELGHRLAELRPGLARLFMSGYPAADLTGRRLAVHPTELIQKPFTRDVLAREVRRVLDART